MKLERIGVWLGPLSLKPAAETRELAAERTGGAHPYFTSPEHTATAREVMGEGPLLAPEQAFLLESDPAAARARAREHTAYYIALDNYRRNLVRLGFAEDDFERGG